MEKAALENCPGVPCSLFPPGPCSNIVGTPTGPSSASVSFGLPTYDGGSPITGYVVTATPTSSAPAKRKSSSVITATGTAPPIIVTGLTFGVNYIFTVLATNIIGPSLIISTTNPVTPCVLNTASASSSRTLPVNTTLTNITHSTTIATGIGTATGLPSGVTASWSSGTITIMGTPTVEGTFNYTIPLTGGCGSVNATGTITVTAALSLLTTSAVTSITSMGASSGGIITADGGASVTARGVVWSTSIGPTINDSKTTNGTGTGTFTSTISGLAASTTYYVRSYATNSAGTSYGNEVIFMTSAAPNTVPGAPIIGTAVRGNTEATVNFTAPSSTGGSAITGYTVTSSPGGLTGTGSGTPITVTGLTNGVPYTFTVVATNAVGNSAASSPSTPVTPATVPGAPTSVVATAGNLSASVAFTAPSSTGGSAITGYTVTSSPGNITGMGTTSPINVTGLTNGTAYTFTVVATNAVGNSNASSISNSVTPAVPVCPTSQVTDLDNNTYNTVAIGNQCWTKTNLKVTQYNDGTLMSIESTGGSNGASMTWQDLVTGAYTIYGNESSTSTNATNYGFLYNWYAAAGIITSGGASTKNICPTGWKVPSDSDWNTLIQYIDNTASATAVGSQSTTAGGKLKSTTLWIAGSPDMPGTDNYGFGALPGGTRVSGGSFSDIGVRTFFWSATESGANSAWGRSLYNYSLGVFRSHDSGNDYKSSGASIRCLKN